MSTILYALLFLLVLACPLMMIFMMKGMGRGKGIAHDITGPGPVDTAHDARIAALEREVANLRGHPSSNVAADVHAAERR